MADYDIGGNQVLKGINGFPDMVPYIYSRYVSPAAKIQNGDAYSLPLLSSDSVQMFKEGNAYTGGGLIATNYLWAWQARSDVYIGIRAFGTGDLIRGLSLVRNSQPQTAGAVQIWYKQSFNNAFMENSALTYFTFLWDTGRPSDGWNRGLYLRFGVKQDSNYLTVAQFNNYSGYTIGDAEGLVGVSIDDLPKNPSHSGSGGGGGTFDIQSDTIAFSTLPTISATASGLMALYCPTEAEIKTFSDWLWSNDVFTTLQKFVASPMDLIISLSIFPLTPDITAGGDTVKIGGIATGATMARLTNQYKTFDCGSINIAEFYGSALDYGQYTKLSIYLPYIGVRELKTDELMGGTISVKYNVDFLTGACVAEIQCVRQNLNAVLYSFEGNMSAQIPLTAKDFSTVYAAILRGVVDGQVSTGNPVQGAAVSSAMSIMAAKPQISRAGSISGNGGHLGLHTPYLILERAIQSLPDNAGMYYGYPSNITAQLSSLSGYTEVEYIVETNIHCTDEELSEIEELLKEGVYL